MPLYLRPSSNFPPPALIATAAPPIATLQELSMGFPVLIYGPSGAGASFPAIVRVPSKLDDRSAA